MLDEDKYVIFTGFADELLMLEEVLDGRFRDKDMDFVLNSVEGYGVVGRVWSEDCDSVTRRECVDGSFVRLGVPGSLIRGKRVKGDVKVVVDGRNVLLEMFA